MWKKITDGKTFYIVVSLLLAFILWLYVSNEVNPDDTGTVRGIKVIISGMEKLEERGLMISAGADQTITLSLQAKRNVLSKLTSDNITITADVSNITEPGTVSLDYRITYPLSVAGEVIGERDKRPEKIELTISRWMERDNVEVRAVFDGSVAEDYQAGTVSLAPQTITVRGREEIVRQIAYAQVTISEQNLSGTYSQETPFVFVDFNGDPLDAATVGELMVEENTILVTLPVVKLKEIPLTIEQIAGGGVTEAVVNIEPNSIIVSGDEADLEALKEIKLDPVELYKVFGTDTLVRSVNLPPELTNVSGVTEATVTVKIEGVVTRTVIVDDISIVNPPDGYAAEKVTTSREIQIRGDQEAVDAVLATQLRIVADLKDITPAIGNQTVPVRVYLDGSSDVGVVGDYNIVISISEEE